MVLLAAAVCSKAGKAIISRQFVEMTRSRIEGLLAAFPKLMSSGKQHTFVETESVRYVYQPLEKLYILLITTKASNILEDLETLRLFARVIPEYCKNLEESDIVDQAFPLIFAFDEIVALGYRENVNLAQIRTFTEMDSHEEKVFQAVRQTQEKEAKEHMKLRARELAKQRHDKEKYGKPAGFGGSGGFGNSSRMDGPVIETTPAEPTKPAYTAPSRPSGTGKAMRLVGKKKDVDTFVGKLESEGETVATVGSEKMPAKITSTPIANQEGVHIAVEEKITLTAGRDGGLQNMEVLGIVKLKVNDEKYGRVVMGIANNDKKGMQFQTHPNIDKKKFTANAVIGLKNPEKPFPSGQDVGVLKWRLQTTDESLMPLTINCWPNESGSKCEVNIEYELQQPGMELNDVLISIPVPSGVGAPVVGDCDGEYSYDNRKNILQWSLPVIDDSNKTGSMEFTISGHANDFFPINVSFVSKKSYCDIQVTEVKLLDDDQAVKYSSEVVFYVDKYEIV